MSERWLYPWAIGSVSFGGASLLVPLYVVELGGGALELGILAAVAAFVGVPAAIFFGRWADRSGKRRRYVLFALGLTALSLMTIPLLDVFEAVILANGVIWFGFAAAMPVVTLLAVADHPGYAWSTRIALLNKFQGVGWAVGLFLGSVWMAIAGVFVTPLEAIQLFFYGMAGLAAIAVLIGFRTFPSEGSPAVSISGVGFRTALRRADDFNIRSVTFPLTVTRFDVSGLHPRRFVERFTPSLALFFTALVLMFTGFAAFFAPLPAYLIDVGFPSEQIFGLYLLSSAASAVCFGLVGRLASSRDIAIVHAGGLVLRGIAFPTVGIAGLMFGAGSVGLMVFGLLFVAIGITWAVITVTAGTIVTLLTPISIRGEALGMYAAMTALAGGIGAIVGGWIAAIDFQLGFATAGALIFIGASIVYRLRGPAMQPSSSEFT